jgi:hypothetical protein
MTPDMIITELERLAVSEQGKLTVARLAKYARLTIEALTEEVEYLFEQELHDFVAAIYAVRRGDAHAALVDVRAHLRFLATVNA